MIQALLNSLREKDLVTRAKMFVTDPSKLFHVPFNFFIAKLALYEGLYLC